eukprot:m.348227 g.348227  ORF g.348227 m.348227 type:complete len:60 (+) comp36040_c0_seq1:119-298(+)
MLMLLHPLRLFHRLVTITGNDLGNVNNVALAPFDTDNYDANDGGADVVCGCLRANSCII